VARLRRPRPRTLAAALVAAGLLAGLLVVPSVLDSDDSDEGTTTQAQRATAGLTHVHALAIEPVEGSLLLASHSGLFRLGDSGLARVGTSRQDLMGFEVAGPGDYVASGHPARAKQAGAALTHLGLIRSTDGGRTWRNVSLAGVADFHILRARERLVYGYDVAGNRFLVSTNRGRTWQRRRVPSDPVFDLAVDPTRPLRALGVFRDGLYGTTNGGRRWGLLSRQLGYLAWPAPTRLYLIDVTGTVFASEDGVLWRPISTLGATPVALTARSALELFVAVDDRTIRHSRDSGRTWQVVASY
jgi:photosystem II stability/assembly factor-like uncharacterized protein